MQPRFFLHQTSEVEMLVCRCAWHPRYYGHPLWHGVASWRGLAVRFTDGICDRCLRRLRADYRVMLERYHHEPEHVQTTPAA